jgi:chondroitin 4-sulfotransferase 11
MTKECKNALFLRIPKTASTSIVKSFERVKVHKKARNFFKSRQNVPLYFSTRNYINVMERSQNWFDLKQNNIFTFGFVRNPWDRAVSSWKFGSSDNSWNMNFVDFCRNLKNLEINPKNGIAKTGLLLHVCEQHPFLICENKNLKADFTGKFENLQNDFNIICDKIGIPKQELPHQNKSKHKHYSEYYDDETKQIVADKYKKDIEYFGYEFG